MQAIEPDSPAAVTTSLATMAAVSELYQNCKPGHRTLSKDSCGKQIVLIFSQNKLASAFV